MKWNSDEPDREELQDSKGFGIGCLIILSLIALAFVLYPVLVSIK